MRPETENPWQTLASDLIYENNWISLTEHQVISPGGKAGIYGVVHFQSDAVGVVPYEDGHIWMVGQYRYALKRYSWEIPEGGSPKGEDPVETAKRELQEETGLIASSYQPLFELHLSNSVSDEWGIVYLATGLTPGPSEPEHTEELQVKKRPLSEIYEEVEKGLITDSLTVAAIYKLKILQLEGKI
jgi:8-oxo-dGTP pyrophosphatase MutT (NUDIX family)